MSILLLAGRGQLSLDDEVREFIPEWADHGYRITIRHLLTHTSGLRDAFLLEGLAPPRGDGGERNDAIVKILARARGLNFTPGTQFQYNNGGYTLLAKIVKQVSGQSFRSFTDANIFKPLGMTHTHFHDDPTMIVPNRASGYHQDARGLHVAARADPGGILGNAGLFTTARDLLLWEQNFADTRVGAPELLAAMQKPVIPTGWPDNSSYGLGLEIGQYRGLRTVGHGGGDPGYAAYVVRYPDQKFAAALLCNVDDAPVGALTQRLADIYLSDVFTTPPASSATAKQPHLSLSAEQLASKIGLYRDPLTESVGRIFIRDGKLMASEGAGEGDDAVELTPVSENRFVVSGTPIAAEFVPAAPGRPQEIHVTGAGPKPVVSQQVTTSFAPSSTELRAFAGEYTSAEVEGGYTVAARASGLLIHIAGRSDIVLQPVYRDAFAGAIVGVVKFSRDAGGVVTGFTAHAPGARGLRFDRVKQ